MALWIALVSGAGTLNTRTEAAELAQLIAVTEDPDLTGQAKVRRTIEIDHEVEARVRARREADPTSE